MPTYVYKGISSTEQKKRLERHMASLVPPEERGQEYYYKPTRNDDPDAVEVKKKRRDAWLAQRREEFLDGLKLEDERRKLGNMTFEKGKPVTVDEHHPLFETLEGLSGQLYGQKRHSEHITVKHAVFEKKAEKADTKKV